MWRSVENTLEEGNGLVAGTALDCLCRLLVNIFRLGRAQCCEGEDATPNADSDSARGVTQQHRMPFY